MEKLKFESGLGWAQGRIVFLKFSVYEAPEPVLAGFGGSYYRILVLAEMPGGVFVGR